VIYLDVGLIDCVFVNIMGKFDYKALRSKIGTRPLDSGKDEFQNPNKKAKIESAW